MEKKGCQAILVVIGAALAIGMVASSLAPAPQNPNAPETAIAFSIGDKDITVKQFNDRVTQIAQNQMMSSGTPAGDLGNHVTAIQAIINDAATSALAAEKGVAITDTNIEATAKTAVQQSFEQVRAQLMMNGLIKPDATEAEANEIVKQQLGGKSIDEAITEQTAEIVKQYKDPETKTRIVSALTPELLKQKYNESVQYTEDDLKASFNEFAFSVIRFDDLNQDLTAREDKAAEAAEKAKGGADFAALQKEYAPNAANEEKSISLTVGLLESSPELASLKNLKVGDVSDVVMYGGSPTVYKLNAVKPNVPPEFEKNKALLLQNARQTRANQQYQKDIEAKTEALKPTFKDEGLEIAYTIFTDMSDQAMVSDKAKLTEYLEGKLAEIRSGDMVSSNYPGLIAATEFIVVESLYGQADAEKQKELIDDRIESANNMLQFFEDNDFRLRFVEDLIKADRKEDAYNYLLTAAENNGDYEATGEAINDRITKLLVQAKAEKTWPEDGIQAIEKELDRWQTERNQAIADQKAFEEEQKKAAAELDKELVPEDDKAPSDPKPESGGN